MSERRMEYRKMGLSGLELSAYSLGGWTTFGGSLTDEELARRIITTAFDTSWSVPPRTRRTSGRTNRLSPSWEIPRRSSGWNRIAKMTTTGGRGSLGERSPQTY